MISYVPWYIWTAIALVLASNVAMFALGVCMGKNNGPAAEPEQDPHENPKSWGQP
jgi:hypothetical protein